ncbi:MAG: DAK2 domain-containing protein, partial [Chloroflexota bacterium]|nr:DAK2 domain-containing protein [Chloroflexota bacterium]
FHIRGKDLDPDGIRDKIASMGESALIVGDPTLIKVHVHAPTPGAILDYGCSVGTITNVVIENMQEQYIDFMAGQTARPPVSAEEIAGMTTVAVAPGPGLARVFESLGVGATISGGQTMNPSTEDILKAINAVKTDKVIVLPNNKNIILAAEQAKQLAKKNVAIVPTATVPQGIAALLAFNFQSDLDANVKAMASAAKHIQTLEITTATRSTQFDGVDVKEGQVIGLVDDVLKVAGEDRAALTLRALKEMHTSEAEIVTVYYGDTVSVREAEMLGEAIRKNFPSQEVEIVSGGQPHYHFIISVE